MHIKEKYEISVFFDFTTLRNLDILGIAISFKMQHTLKSLSCIS